MGHDLGNAAEWFGALGTALAIGAAIWVGNQSVQAEERRIEARGRVVAFRLAPHMVNMIGDVRRVREALKHIETRGFPAKEFIFLAEHHAFDIPTAVPPDVFSESWTLPPEIALSTAQLDMVLITHHRFTKGLDSVVKLGSLEKHIDLAKRLNVSLTAIERLATEIRDHGAAVSDAIVRKSRGLIPYG